MPIRPEHQRLLTEWLRDGLARQWREQLEVTQEQAAHLIGVRLGTFGRWERGEALPRAPRNQKAYTVINKWRQQSQQQGQPATEPEVTETP